MKVRLNNVRMAFSQHLFQAQKNVNDDGSVSYSHSAVFLLPPDHPDLPTLKKAMQEAAKEAWGAKAKDVYAQLTKKDRVCLRDGADKADQYDGFEGMLYVSTRSKTKPKTLDQAKNAVTERDGVLYSGAFVTAVIDVYAQDNQYGKRINAQLMGVQKFRDGDAFGGGKVADDDDFDDVSVTDDDGNEVSGEGSLWDEDDGDDLAA